MSAEQRSRFREIHEMIRAMEERLNEKFELRAADRDRRMDWLVEENTRLRIQVERMWTRVMTPDVWRDEKPDRRDSA